MTCVRVFVRAGQRVSGARTRPKLILRLRVGNTGNTKGFLATCNKASDEKATESLQGSPPGEFPFTGEQVPATALQVEGKLVVCVASMMDAIYDTEMCRRASGITGWDARWLAVSQVAELKAGTPTAEGEKKVTLLRHLGTQEERDHSRGKCVRCGREDEHRAAHLRDHCPEFYLQWVQAFHKLLEAAEPKLGWPRGGVSDLEVWFVKGEQRLWISVVADENLQWYLDGHPGQEVLLSIWSGQFFMTVPIFLLGPWK